VALAPLVVLNLAGLALMLPATTALLGGAMVVLNTSGAIGDLWMAAIMLASPRWLHVEDMGLGLLAWAPPGHDAEAVRMHVPGGPGILPGTPDPAVIAAGRQRAAGTHTGRGWRVPLAWWLVLSVTALPAWAALTVAFTPIHPRLMR
jgi:hypothetical protein